MTEKLWKNGDPDRRKYTRRDEDGLCLLHKVHTKCFEKIREDIKALEFSGNQVDRRISAIEPTVEHNKTEIDSMRRIQLATLVTGIFSLIGILSGVILLYLRHIGV